MPSILEDLLNEELTEDQAKIIARDRFDSLLELPNALRAPGRSRTPTPAANLNQFYNLVRLAIQNKEQRAGTTNPIRFTEEDTNIPAETETIVFSLINRRPGAFAGGPPGTNGPRNLKPRQRELISDPENPGNRIAIMGYWYENIVRFTCWARTNKTANERALWFEDLMIEYDWWFCLQGVNRVIFQERHADIVTQIDNNRWYGRPIDYFVKTEDIRAFQEKAFEEILINVKIGVS
jgi:hypothetical protein